jgi:hypothetical protein
MNSLGSQFSRDIEGMITGLKGNRCAVKSQNRQGWKIIDTDQWNLLLMSGTDIEGSCQSVDTNPSTNKCLMAYVLDGKNRMLAIIDADGKIMARCILRILLDSKSKQAVLYREEFYPETIRADYRDALETLAILRAKQLGLPLLISASTVDSYQYANPVESIFSPAPHEYVDANFDQAANGIFRIDTAQVIYAPSIMPSVMLEVDASNPVHEITLINAGDKQVACYSVRQDTIAMVPVTPITECFESGAEQLEFGECRLRVLDNIRRAQIFTERAKMIFAGNLLDESPNPQFSLSGSGSVVVKARRNRM